MDLEIKTQMVRVKDELEISNKRLEQLMEQYMRDIQAQMNVKVSEMEVMLSQIKGLDIKVEERLKLLQQTQFDIKQENISFRNNLSVSINQLVDNRVEILEKEMNSKLFDLEEQMSEMERKMNKIRPDVTVEIDEKIRRAKLSSGTGIGIEHL